MDFVGAVSREIFDISWYWWIVLVVVIAGTWMVRRNIVVTLLVGYIFIILIVTLFNRSFTVAEPQLKLFWSYGKPELVNEVLLNYILFVPLGILLEYTDEKLFRIWMFAVVMSLSIEALQLVFSRGLFEFDDVFGNSVGCLLGVIGCHFIRGLVK
ncbi:MAG: VanZ family protein, partial [Lachnospira sp.]|nr:VanZ family protein [Lachnospira sp.]